MQKPSKVVDDQIVKCASVGASKRGLRHEYLLSFRNIRQDTFVSFCLSFALRRHSFRCRCRCRCCICRGRCRCRCCCSFVVFARFIVHLHTSASTRVQGPLVAGVGNILDVSSRGHADRVAHVFPEVQGRCGFATQWALKRSTLGVGRAPVPRTPISVRKPRRFLRGGRR